MFIPQTAVVSSQRSSLSSGSGACAHTAAASNSHLCSSRAEFSRKQLEKRELLREHAALAARERWMFELPLERDDLPDEVRARVADMRHLVTLTTRLEVEAAAEATTNKKGNGKKHRKKKHALQARNGNGGAQQSRAAQLSSTSCFA